MCLAPRRSEEPPGRSRRLGGRRGRRTALALALAACALATACSTPGGRGHSDLPVQGLVQRHSLSCEACAGVLFLAAHGLAVDEDVFLAGIPRSDNPDLGFVGDPDGPPGCLPPRGYGVHAEPVAARLRDFGLDARAERGRGRAWLEERLRAGLPVVVWATGDMEPRAAVTLRDRAGRTFRAVRWEHALLAVGFDAGDVRLLDPGTGARRCVPWPRFLAAWGSLDGMAVWAPRRPDS